MDSVASFLSVLREQPYIYSYFDQLCATASWKATAGAESAEPADQVQENINWDKCPVCTIGFGREFYRKMASFVKPGAAALTPVDPFFLLGIDQIREPDPIYPDRYAEGYRTIEGACAPFDIFISLAHDELDLLKREVDSLREKPEFENVLVNKKYCDWAVIQEYGIGPKAAKEGKVLTALGYKDGISERRSLEEVGRLTLREESELTLEVSNRRTPYTYGTFLFFQKIELDVDAFIYNKKKIVDALKVDRLKQAEHELNRKENFFSEAENFFSRQLINYKSRLINFGAAKNDENIPDVVRDPQDDKGLDALAAALMMGRFPKGTPLMLEQREGLHYDQLPFDYKNDPEGWTCPFQAHIRRVNPRENGFSGAKIVRRSSYFPNMLSEFKPESKGQGLFFVSLQRSITEQLMPILKNIAVGGRLDPIAYGGGGTIKFEIPSEYLHRNPFAEKDLVDLKRVAKYRGGDFFYVPSLAAIDGYVKRIEERKIEA